LRVEYKGPLYIYGLQALMPKIIVSTTIEST